MFNLHITNNTCFDTCDKCKKVESPTNPMVSITVSTRGDRKQYIQLHLACILKEIAEATQRDYVGYVEQS